MTVSEFPFSFEASSAALVVYIECLVTKACHQTLFKAAREERGIYGVHVYAEWKSGEWFL